MSEREKGKGFTAGGEEVQGCLIAGAEAEEEDFSCVVRPWLLGCEWEKAWETYSM